KRSSYSVAEKLQVLQYAKQYGLRSAGRHFTIDPSMISRWQKQEEELDLVKQKKRRRIGNNLGRKAKYPEAEAELKAWIVEFRQDGIAVTPKIVKTYMKELLANQFSNIYPGASEKFLASESWFYRFLRRYDFAMRRKTKIGQKLPAHLDIKLLEFQQFIIKKQKQFEYELSEIGNMDETPVYFDMVGNLTIDKRGAKTVQVRTTGNDKNRFTCVLTILADGTKLPPIVIFKGKRMPKNLPSQIIVLMHPKGWMDEIGMKAWFDKVWKRRPGNRITRKKALLVMDSFEGHKTDSIKKIAQNENTDLAIIPG
ncbi:4274_t:CDS:2, partial [Entrophospora sp. SA101]